MPSSSSPPSSSYIKLHKWAESDAEFVRSLSSVISGSQINTENRPWWAAPPPPPPPAIPAVVDSFSCRQIYLKSYTFSKKETMPEKTIKCFGKCKREAIDHLHCFSYYDIRDGRTKEYKRKMVLKKKTKKEKGSSVFFFVFNRLISCKGGFKVVDGWSNFNLR